MKIKHTSVIIALIGLMFIVDGVSNTVLHKLGFPFWRHSIFVRALTQFWFLLLLIGSPQGRKVYLIYFLFYIIFIIGALATVGYSVQYNWGENFAAVNKVLFFFLCSVVFRLYFRTDSKQRKLFKLYEILIIVQIVAVMAGFIFQLRVFSSYLYEKRFGYKGLIPAVNEASAFFLIAFFYFLWKFECHQQGGICLMATTVAGLITGTKALLILPVILLFYIVKWNMRKRTKKGHLLIGVAFLLLTGVAFLKRDYILSTIQPTITYLSYFVNVERRSYWNVFTSGRGTEVSSFFTDVLPHLNLLNYLFGGIDREFTTETDFVDIIASFGLIGGSVFYFLYLKALFCDNKGRSFTPYFFSVIWCAMSAVAGHFIFSAINGVYLAILLLSFLNRDYVLRLTQKHSKAR